ncbi:MAG: FkbM family methyltransferase [Candidatus Dormibacteraeota bacterium]|nr:FkbM family methyltransferase [Candidatus Dormibacteraeota bacterium]
MAGYGSALAGVPAPRTVIDLGANAGWFEVWLAHQTRSRAFRSLLVEADPRLVREAQWHLRVNRLAGRVVHGAAGVGSGQLTVPFFVSPSASQSSLREEDGSGLRLPPKGARREVWVPVISVEEEWQQCCGESRVDLLKVDIEGAEADFFKVEGAFVARKVRRIVVEWDKWMTDGHDLQRQLEALSFKKSCVVKEDHRTGVAVFDASEPH